MSGYSALFSDSAGTEPPTTSVPAAPYRLLFVDDEPNVLAALKRVFRLENYLIQTAANAAEALALLEQQAYQLVISDFKMPGMHGGDLLRAVRAKSPETLRILLTGQADTEAVMSAIKEGAVYRFILKPWNDDDLRLTVALALEQYELLQKNRKLEHKTEQQSRDLDTLAKISVSNRSQLAILLHKKGLLTSQQLQALHKEMHGRKLPLIRLLLEHAWLSEARIRELLRKELMFEDVDLKEIPLDPAIMSLVTQVVCQRQLIVPLRTVGKRLKLAMADPMDSGLIEELNFATGFIIEPVMADVAAIQGKLKEFYGEGEGIKDLATLVSAADPFETIQIVLDEEEEASLEELLSSSDEPPAIRLVNAVISEALRLRASDIHIQPRAKSVVVRYRIDGVLSDKIQIPINLLLSVVSRIKVMAELDITERRRPQDGRITVKAATRTVDLRISTLPTINGEKVVMRVLDRQSSVQRIELLGLSEHNRDKLLNVVTKPQGIILATGPTGSGKTTTLYALLQHDASSQKNYVTIEDPVEFYVDLAGQVPVRERIGLSFASILRAILRQDPDVILLGEIRDHETAEVAFHAAMTGHVVYSTLHTSSAVATIARLLDLGLKPYVLASALEAIIAQRLLRRICTQCKAEVQPDPVLRARLGPLFQDPELRFYAGAGCERCSQGYTGRVGIHEVLVISDAIRDGITQGLSNQQLVRLAQAEGMRTLLDDARDKLGQGLVTAEEVLRVLGSQAQL